MSSCNLRVYYGPATEEQTNDAQTSRNDSSQVTLRLNEVLPLLADAVQSERTWLRDFRNDSITISSDLHEVLLAYQHFRRPSA